MDNGVRESTFEEEVAQYKMKVDTLSTSQDLWAEVPFINDIIRSGNRIIRKAENLLERMTANEYQIAALRTINPSLSRSELLENGLMGLNGEAGECIDLLKKHMFQGHELDEKHVAKELGDIAWYLAISAHAIGYDLETIFRMNVEKLNARYPDGFTSELSTDRKTNDI